MEKETLRIKKNILNRKSFIILLVLCLGIGFAYLTSNLTINGNTTVSGTKWSVYFNKVDISEGSVEATVEPTVTATTTTTLDYRVLLDKPGDFYEFTVEVKNDGTIDAMIDSITMTSLETDVSKYLSYTATYEDGTSLAQNDVLKKKSTATYIVRVEYKKNISASDLSENPLNLTLSFGVNDVQSTIRASKAEASEFAKLVKDNILSDSGLNFAAISSDSNGKGLYVLSGTENNDYPIYYYRGAVTNNNAKFGGFCWKIVRTTETGGTKLIYNGTPNASGECVNTTGATTQLSAESEFNEDYESPAYNGYMYGTVYAYGSGSTSSSHVYGNTFTYENGTYTLSDDTHAGVDSTHHYTCLSSGTTCESIKYVYYLSGSTAYYITLTGGKNINTALAEMQTNTTNSTIKTAVDNWFSGTFATYFTTNNKDYDDYLEDTVWCNDRSMNTIDADGTGKYNNSGWIPNGGSIINYLWYSAYGRMKAGTPSLTCSNKNDSFTVEESATGNGALTYPVGLLTVDEIILAGGRDSQSPDCYLYTNQTWWPLSPYHLTHIGVAMFDVTDIDNLLNALVSNKYGVRPSISLKSGVKIADGGDGSSATPYEFVVE